MATAILQRRPTLVVVAGRPGSGKTTLARLLARDIRCPLLSRDEVKEGVVNTFRAAEGIDLQRLATEAFFEAVEVLIRRGVTLVAEAAFQEKLWAPRLTTWRQLAKLRLVLCDPGPELALQRRLARGLADPTWEQFHPDPILAAARQNSVPPAPPTQMMEWVAPLSPEGEAITVNTRAGYLPALEEIVAFIRA